MDINRRCSFRNCGNSTLNKKDCYFYEFPVDFNLCLQWVENVGNKDFFDDFAYGGAVPFRRKYICSDHFRVQDFICTGNIYAGIKPGAVPCLTSKVAILEEDPLQNISVKTEPSEKEFWDTKEFEAPAVFPVELLENVKAEEVSSQSISSGMDPLLTVDFHLVEKPRSKNAEIVAIRRAKESPEERSERRRKNAERAALQRSIESEEKTLMRRYQNAQRNSIRRSLETAVERDIRRKRNAERQSKKRKNETPEQREIRRMKDLLRSRRRRLQETEEQANLRKLNDAARAQARRQNESEEERNVRRLNDIIRITNRRKNESPEERRERLKKNREYSAKRRYIQKLECELTHPKNLIDDTSLSLRNFEEDVTSINMNLFQPLGVYSKSQEYHYFRDVLPDNMCRPSQTDKFLPLADGSHECVAHICSQLLKTPYVNNNSMKNSSDNSIDSMPDTTNEISQLVLL